MDKAADISLFLRVFDAGSISAAARSLDLSVAVASQRLKRLESDLGVRLFQRTTRQLHPTPEGLALAEQGRALIDDLEALTASLREAGMGIAGTLRLTTSATFGRQYISPLLPEFMAAQMGNGLLFGAQRRVGGDEAGRHLVCGGVQLLAAAGGLCLGGLLGRSLVLGLGGLGRWLGGRLRSSLLLRCGFLLGGGGALLGGLCSGLRQGKARGHQHQGGGEDQ